MDSSPPRGGKLDRVKNTREGWVDRIRQNGQTDRKRDSQAECMREEVDNDEL